MRLKNSGRGQLGTTNPKPETARRRGVILLVVLVLLTLFAIVGITFVFYAEQTGVSSKNFNEAQARERPTDDLLLSVILSQMIFGTEDTNSALIGNSLLESMYGQYGQGSEINQAEIPVALMPPVPYTGPGMPPNPRLVDVDLDNRIGLFDLNFRDPLTGIYINQGPGKIIDNNGNRFIDYEDMKYPIAQGGWANGLDDPVGFGNGLVDDFVDLSRMSAFTGSGKLNYPDPTLPPRPPPAPPWNGYYRINFRGLETSPTGVSRSPILAPGRGAFNAPYTYPDHNTPWLGAITADGTIIARSFVRSQEPDPLNPTAPANPYLDGTTWSPAALPHVAAKVIRPLPRDNYAIPDPANPGQFIFLFPAPEDPGGDVKNVIGARQVLVAPGVYARNDSYWMDLNFPIQTGPDGRRYKPLFAMFVMDMDGKLNVNEHFNGFGIFSNPSQTFFLSLSNQGHGPWEVGLPQQSQLAMAPYTVPNFYPEFDHFAREYGALLQGRAAGLLPPASGRYQDLPGSGLPGRPAKPPLFPLPEAIPNSLVLQGPFYAPIDYNAYRDNPARSSTNPPHLPGQTSAIPMVVSNYSAFPIFPAGYENTDPLNTNPLGLRFSHPLLYKYFGATPNDRRIRTAAVEGLLRMNDTGADTNSSDIVRLLPDTFGWVNNPGPFPNNPGPNNRLRWLLTTDSVDRGSAGHRPVSPVPPTALSDYDPLYPRQSVRLRAIAKSPTVPAMPGFASTYNPYFDPVNYPSDRYPLDPSLQEAGQPIYPPFIPKFPGQRFDLLNLTSPVPPPNTALSRMAQYPLPTLGGSANTPAEEIDMGNLATRAAFLRAQIDRQRLAKQIYALLVESTLPLDQATGAGDLLNGPPIPPDPMPTFPPTAPGLRATLRRLAQLAVNIVDYIDEDHYSTPFNWGNVGGFNIRSDPSMSTEWVYGTELPRLLLNEGYAESTYDSGTTNYTVSLWLELLNPLYTDTVLRESGAARFRPTSRAIRPYQIVVGRHLDLPANNTTGNMSPADTFTTVDDFTPDPNLVNAGVQTDVVMPSNNSFDGGTPTADPADADREFFDQGLNRGWCLIGPRAAGANTAQDLPKGTGPLTPRLPKNTYFPADPMMANTPNLTFTVTPANPPPPAGGQAPLKQITVALRRLACPHLPPDNNPGSPTYNPYITVDTMTVVNDPDYNPTDPNAADTDSTNNFNEIHDTATVTTPASRWSVGREQPYAGHHSRMRRQLPDTNALDPLLNPLTEQPQHTFMRHNYEYWPDTTNPGMNVPTVPPNVPPNPPGYPAPPPPPPPAPPTPPAAPVSNTPTLKMPFDWLVHLDRPMVSASEALHVSAFPPHELTQRFMSFHDADGNGRWDTRVPPGPENNYTAFQHLAPWFWDDPTVPAPPATMTTPPDYPSIQRPLFTFLEFVETRSLSQWNDQLSRRSGKLNLNTIWDQEMLEAILDLPIIPPQLDRELQLLNPAWNAQQRQDIWTLAKQNLWATLRANRDGVQPGGAQQPILGIPRQSLAPSMPGIFSQGPFWSLTGMDPLSPYQPTPGQVQQPVLDGWLRTNFLSPSLAPAAAQQRLWGSNSARLLELMNPLSPGGAPAQPLFAHPFERAKMLSKITNNLTTRSNVFAVWVTVGFFEVHSQPRDPSQPFNPVNNPMVDKLGAEIGRADGQHKRHRFFAVLDRSVFERYIAPAAIGFNPYARYDPRKDYTSFSDPVLGTGPPSAVLHWTVIE